MTRVFLNGCFDILTPGHFNLLMYAREMAGDGSVIVALDEDEKIMADKGLSRPIFNVHDRAKAILSLRFKNKSIVDTIDFFGSNLMLEHLIKKYRPTYIIKGSDWCGKKVIGSDIAPVLYFDRSEHSTTGIIEAVLSKHNGYTRNI